MLDYSSSCFMTSKAVKCDVSQSLLFSFPYYYVFASQFTISSTLLLCQKESHPNGKRLTLNEKKFCCKKSFFHSFSDFQEFFSYLYWIISFKRLTASQQESVSQSDTNTYKSFIFSSIFMSLVFTEKYLLLALAPVDSLALTWTDEHHKVTDVHQRFTQKTIQKSLKREKNWENFQFSCQLPYSLWAWVCSSYIV